MASVHLVGQIQRETLFSDQLQASSYDLLFEQLLSSHSQSTRNLLLQDFQSLHSNILIFVSILMGNGIGPQFTRVTQRVLQATGLAIEREKVPMADEGVTA